jgi:hypothetical protein
VRIRTNSSETQNQELTDTKSAIVVEPPPGGGQKKIPLDAPDIVAVRPGDQFWKDNEWTEENAAEVKEGSSIVIYVSFGNKWLIGVLTGSGYTSTKQELLRSKYLLHMAFYAYLQNKGLKDLGKNGSQEGVSAQSQNISEELLDKIRLESLEWLQEQFLPSLLASKHFQRLKLR